MASRDAVSAREARLAIVRGERVRHSEHRGKDTGVVSERTYHTALLSGRPPPKEAGAGASTGLFATILEAARARALVRLTDHGAPKGSVRGYDTETSMLHTKRHVRSKI